jgi:hypothetical protein
VPDPTPATTCCWRSRCRGPARSGRCTPEALLVFITPPSPEEQERRLRGRGDPEEIVAKRLAKAAEEAGAAAELGALTVVNDDLDTCVEEVAALVEAARRETGGRRRFGRTEGSLVASPMPRRQDTMMNPTIEVLLEKVDSKFTLVSLASRRARR